MLRTLALLQLTLWAATIHAFFPWRPCEVDRSCPGSRPRSLDAGSSPPSPHATLPRGQSFNILRAPNVRIPRAFGESLMLTTFVDKGGRRNTNIKSHPSG